MLPPASVLTNENRGVCGAEEKGGKGKRAITRISPAPFLTFLPGPPAVFRGVIVAVLAAVGIWVSGCSPPGPRALLQGKQLLDEGRFSDAVPMLERAASLLP